MALVIGISQYTEIDSLKFADADALEFSQLLTEFSTYKKDNVTVLLNQKATKKRVVEEIQRFVELSKKQPFDNFIFMFAGHGIESRIRTTTKNQKIEEKETNIFLAPSDASLNQNNFFLSSDGKELSNDTFINKLWLAKQLAAIRAKSISIVIDSCYSGNKSFFTLLEREGGYKSELDKFAPRQLHIEELHRPNIENQSNSLNSKNMAYLASSRDDQASAEYDELRHGAMSYVIFEYIKKVRASTGVDQSYSVPIDGLYENIVNLFQETRVNGVPLSAAHQPILFALPDYKSVGSMEFLKIQGVLKQLTEQEIQAIKKPKFRIVSDIEEIELYIDGTKSASKPNSYIELNPGKYLFEVYLPSTGYRISFTRDLIDSQTIDEKINLIGKLEVASLIVNDSGKSPGPDLEIFINGKRIDKTKFLVTNLIVGTHQLEVKYENVTKVKQVEIRPESPLRVNYTVKKETVSKDEDSIRNVLF